jgi:hypothetical protein
MKLIKLFYRIEDDIDYICLDQCPFEIKSKFNKDSIMYCGSVGCQECKHCLKSGEENIWTLSEEKGLVFNQGYVICQRCYSEYTLKMKLMRISHKLKLLFRK